MNTNESFAQLLTQVTPEEFVGLAKYFDIKILTTEVDPQTKKAIARPAEDVLLDILTSYDRLNRSDKRKLVKQLTALQRRNARR